MGKSSYNSRCHVCTSPDRKILIETALIQGASAEVLAAKINEPINGKPVRFISAASIRRHKTHVPAALIAKLSVRALRGALAADCDLETLRKQESNGLLQLVIGYRAQLDTLIDAAIFQGNLGAVATLIGKRNDLLNFAAKLLHEIGGSTTVINQQNFLVSPIYLQLRTLLIKALQGPQHAVSRVAVLAALAEVEKMQPIGVPGADESRLATATDAGVNSASPDAAPATPPLLLEDHSGK